MEKVLESTLLYDFYSELLTEKQRQMFAMYYLDDLSLSEIGEEFDISRQAVHDILYRTEKKLYSYEEKLRLVSRHMDTKRAADEIIRLAKSCISSTDRRSIAVLTDELLKIIAFAEQLTDD